jgi:hypothetical protein
METGCGEQHATEQAVKEAKLPNRIWDSVIHDCRCERQYPAFRAWLHVFVPDVNAA